MYMFHANLKTLKVWQQGRKQGASNSKLSSKKTHATAWNKTKQSCGRPSPRDQNGLISHQILHLKKRPPKKPQTSDKTWKITNTKKTNDGNIQVQQQKLPQKHQRELYTQTDTWETGKRCQKEGSKNLPQKRNWWNESQALFPSNKSPPRTSLSHTHTAQNTKFHQRRRKMKILIKKWFSALSFKKTKKTRVWLFVFVFGFFFPLRPSFFPSRLKNKLLPGGGNNNNDKKTRKKKRKKKLRANSGR